MAGAAAGSGSYLWAQHRGPGQPIGMMTELDQMPERHINKSEIAEAVHMEIARDEAGLSLDEMVRSTKPDMNLEHLERLADELKHQRLIDQHEEAVAKAAEEAYTAGDDDAAGDDYFDRVRYFDQEFPDDIILTGREWDTLVDTAGRLRAVQDYVGFGNFNILSWDDMLAFARNVSDIGAFQPEELEFLESLFFADARDYGFYGERTGDTLTTRINRADVEKVPASGHFLLRGESLDLFNRLQSDIGDSLILTSGVRSIPKQFDLFLAKARQTEGNLSKASRSLAPPGYSYHAIGDFDVGKYGLGLGNFSEEFARTSVFKQLQESGYTNIRYTVDNRFGVRFEPWHVRAVG